MPSKSLALLTAAGLVLGGACSLAVDLDNLSGGPPKDALDGGGGAGGDADAGPTTCESATHPPPPEAATAGGDLDFTVALRSIDIGEAGAAITGLDLDKTCTCHFGQESSCILPDYADEDHCDDAQGRDNGIAKVFATIQVFLGPETFGSAYYSSRAEEGRWSLLVRVFDYNGEPNDAQVSVAIYTTKWNDAVLPKPAWDGNDVWPVSADSLADGVTLELPKYTDTKAYVTDGVLVGTLPEVHINLSGNNGSVGLRLTAGTVLGKLEEVNGRFKISEGMVAARWKAADVFKIISSITAGDTPLCADGSFTYEQFKELVCGHIDIASTLGGSTTECDALSFGMAFATEPVLLGSPYMPEQEMPNCPPDQDPANDTCDGD